MEYRQGDTRADGYRFLSYEKKVRRPRMRRVADELAAYVAGERTREEVMGIARDWREGTIVYVEKWAKPERFEKQMKRVRTKKGSK